jgi:hypothetical protein
MSRIDPDERQVPVRLVGMVAPHLLEDGEEVLLSVVWEATMDEVDETLFIGLDTRWQPQRSGLDIANEGDRTGVEGFATQCSDRVREVPQVGFGSGIHPAIGGVVAKGENKRGDKAGLIAISCCLNSDILNSL